MGEVWRGTHAKEGVGVAIKFVRTGAGPFRTAFHNEVAQMARLDHPHIVRVLDQGAVPLDVEKATGGEVLGGGPWLAMELASAGSMADADPPRTWGEVRSVLGAILDALGYAHALGVLHRDLKPANVLAHHRRDLRPGLKLTDFGLAHVWDDDRAHTGMARAGTPEFMAPEQAAGSLRDQGPWTDLYALGCMAWQLVAGAPPFQAHSGADVLRAHLRADLPPLLAKMAVPAGLEEWLNRLLAKRAQDRFALAADASWALQQLGQPSDDASSSLDTSWGSMLGDTWTPMDVALDMPAPDLAVAAAGEGPPIPDDWRREVPRSPLRLVGAGLGLWGLRPVPLVGREDIRDRLWEELRAVTQDSTPRGTLLTGPAGYGKTRLSEWLGNRVREVGAAHVLWAGHAPIAGPWDGVGRMLARQFRAHGCDPDEARRRIASGLKGLGIEDAFDTSAMLSWLWPGRAPIRDSERAQVLVRFIKALARDRPVLLVADHAQWGPQTLGALKTLLSQPELRLQVLLTWQEDGQPHPGAVEALAELEDLGLRRDRVGELTSMEMRQLVGELLILDDHLSDQVRSRAAGCPLFAVQLVGDWVRRGVLQVGEEGFELAPGEAARLPDDIHGMWLDRLAGLDELHGLELGAALSWFSDRIGPEEWSAACERAGTAMPDAEELAAGGLLVPEDGGWRFIHGMMRESLGRNAEEGGRWHAWHVACAQAVDPTRPARVGRHLLLAGRPEEALGPLLDGVDEALRGTQLRLARELLDACDPIEIEASDERNGRRGVLGLRCDLGTGDFDRLTTRAARLGPRALRYGWFAVLASCQRYRGMAAEKRGDPLLAEALLRHARDLASEHGAELEAARASLHLANLSRLRGDPDALPCLEEALSVFQRLDDGPFQAEAYTTLAAIHATFGRLDEAEAAAQRAAEIHAINGDRLGRGLASNELGEIRRKRGLLEQAQQAYETSWQLLDGAGSHGRLYPLANLGVTRLEMFLASPDQPAAVAADRALSDALDRSVAGREKVLQAYLRTLRLVVDVELERWERFEVDLTEGERLLEETGLMEPDLGRFLDWSAARCGDPTRSEALTRLAATQHR